MTGYNIYSMSNNAVDAYARGLRPASQLGRIPGVTSLDVAAFAQPAEWHHTSKRFNRTNFYCPTCVAHDFGAAGTTASSGTCPTCQEEIPDVAGAAMRRELAAITIICTQAVDHLETARATNTSGLLMPLFAAFDTLRAEYLDYIPRHDWHASRQIVPWSTSQRGQTFTATFRKDYSAFVDTPIVDAFIFAADQCVAPPTPSAPHGCTQILYPAPTIQR